MKQSRARAAASSLRFLCFMLGGMGRDTLRMIFGFSLLVIMAALATAIALGHVEEKTSYGLMPLLTALATLAGGFAQWAFSAKDKDGE